MLNHFKKEFQFKNLSLNFTHLNDDYDDDDLLKLFYDAFVSIILFY